MNECDQRLVDDGLECCAVVGIDARWELPVSDQRLSLVDLEDEVMCQSEKFYEGRAAHLLNPKHSSTLNNAIVPWL